MTKTLAGALHSEVIIKKSRFLGCIEPIDSHQAGKQRLAELKAQHPEARHLCFCMLVEGQVLQSDDGEPSGTAALPMLRVLQHKQLDRVLATVVRYFGGTKLGAGGLVRAYSQAISEPLNSADLIEVKTLSELCLQLDYEFESQLRHQAEERALTLEVDYQQQIIAKLTGEAEDLELCRVALQEASSGRIQVL
ncbi:uncharacterized protein, YigZ family [Marinospirillum celere]|uniref:Uncharacterized protein, YigZ family n=1 Tax=Marinospirillum celere TaxID=1122252 RepID=A0A1I1EN98_9GAMM|nr:YigZ family protein [Marinospirillum celere]SFB88136.1 uncharacterized protein, YigZ family [Marinospirillum celere]